MSGRVARAKRLKVKRPYSRGTVREFSEALGVWCVSEWFGRLAPRFSRSVHRAYAKQGRRV